MQSKKTYESPDLFNSRLENILNHTIDPGSMTCFRNRIGQSGTGQLFKELSQRCNW